MLYGLFVLKANQKRVKKILEEENFVFTDQDIENILKGNQKGQRYGSAILSRREGENTEKRFIKVMLDGKWKTYKPFRRQVKVTEALHKDKNFKHPTMAVLSYSLKPFVPYAVFETREDGDNFGFMHDSPEYYGGFDLSEITKLVDVIYSFHFAGLNVDPQIMNYTVSTKSNLSYYEDHFEKLLNKKIKHKPLNKDVVEKTVEDLIESYTNIRDIRPKVLNKFRTNWETIDILEVKKENFFVHADMQIDNVYKTEKGDFELLDFEWVGKTNNPAISIMWDYGNLRARAWSSPDFQNKLDEAMLGVGVKHYKNKSFIEASLVLGILFRGVMMARYHLDFINTTKNDKRSEEMYHQMYQKTLESLKKVLM